MFPLIIVCAPFVCIHLSYLISTASISPDGRTLLSVGDSNKVYFHRITGGAQVTFSPINTLEIPPPDSLGGYSTSSLAASFSTAFSSDGSKFAVASQEGLVAVWDVRGMSKPIKVFQTDKTRVPGGSTSEFIGNGLATGWLSDDPWEWTRGNKAPGWCVRNVKFNGGDGARLGKEVMAFTEVSFLFQLSYVYIPYESRHSFIAHVVRTYC
jgi:WD40 repeat protein